MTDHAASTADVASLKPATGSYLSSASRIRFRLQLSLTFGFLVLGILLALQVNTQKAIRREGAGLVRPERWYQMRLSETEKRIRELEANNTDLAKRVAQFEQSSGQSSRQSELLKRDLDATRAVAGLTSVTGPGVIVDLADNPRKGQEELFGGVVHDEDLLLAVNELWNAGAEAIAVNGIRLSAGWQIRCAGSIINVCGKRVASPYKIEAIGDPSLLKSAWNMPNAVADRFKNVLQLKVAIRTAQSVTLPAGSIEKPKLAQPVMPAKA